METDSDEELILRFCVGKDEHAFRRLVERHSPMVRGVAMRSTSDLEMADEVTQNVFAILARRAASVPSAHLTGWLHNAAVFSARNARRKFFRYQKALSDLRQNTAMDSSESDPAISEGSAWEDIRPHLDEAVSRLPEKARLPLMLRFFEGKSIREIADVTGRSEGACRKTLERSLQSLSGILKRRGILSSGTALGIMLSTQTLLAPPASAAVLAAAALQAAPTVFSSVVSSLSFQTFAFMAAAQTAKISLLSILVASIPVGLLWRDNSTLRREVRELKALVATASKPVAAIAKPVSGNDISAKPKSIAPARKPIALGEGPVGFGALFSKEALIKRASEDAARSALQETERISLYLPELTANQREQIRTALETRNKDNLERLKQAFESGAFERVMNTPEKATDEDRALMAAAAPSTPLPPQDDPLAPLLSADQFATYQQKQEEKRLSDAEAAAADGLKVLNAGLDLSPDQKDRIFQELAQIQLSRVERMEGESSNAFLDQRARDEAKQRIIRDHLTPEQATIFEKRTGELKQGIEDFLKAVTPKEK